jgi:hypothetical protein
VRSEEEAVLAAYQGYWDTWLAATNPPDPGHPDLARFATGEALERDLAAITNYRQLSQFVRLPVSRSWAHDASVLALKGDRAVIIDCSIDDTILVDRPSGRILNDAVATYEMRAAMVRDGAGWKVERLDVMSKWEGVAGCAA